MEAVIGYARISSTAVKKGAIKVEGDNNSIEVQVKNIKEYCKFKNLNLVEILIDEDVSGGKEFATRAGGKKATAYFKEGIKTIVATKVDRMFRDTADALLTVKDFNKQDICIHYSDMGGATFSTKTAIGKLIFTMVVANAEFEKDMTGERVKAVLNNKKDTGKVYCASILGFDNVEGKMVPNVEEQKTISFIFENAKDKKSPAKIADKLNDLGYNAKKGGMFYPSTIQHILKNPIYK